MNRSVLAAAVAGLVFGGVALGVAGVRRAPAAPAAEREPADADTSYAVGFDLGASALVGLDADGVEIDRDALLEGLTDAIRTGESRLGPDRARRLLERLDAKVRTRRAEARMDEDPVFRALPERNLQRSHDFHAQFGAEQGAVTLPSGIQYRVKSPGQGDPARAGDTVVVSFRGTLLDGREFARADMAELVVAEVMPGAREALMKMRAGGRWLVCIPPQRAFSLGGRDPDIGPNESLIIDVTLHEIRRVP